MITVHTDGATNVKTNQSGAGIYMKHNGKFYSYKIPLGEMSNHKAEFHAVIHALTKCNEQFPNEILAFQTDSKIVVESIEKNFVRNRDFQPLLEQINDLSARHPHFFIKWIPSKENFHADQLAKRAIYLNKG